MLYGYELQSFKTIFISIILEAMPFILIGVVVSSFIHVFISDKIIRKYIPKDPMLAILFACLLGILFPICECGLIPIVRRLIIKGMPVYVGIVFILVGPIINPIVFASTYLAFRTKPEMVYSRMGLALMVGVFIGLFIYYFVKKSVLKNSDSSIVVHDHEHADPADHPQKLGARILSMLEHAGSEFIDIGKYVVLGSLLTAAIQTLVSKATLVDIGQGEISSNLFMMGFAYVISLCSTSDAFVASSFASTFSGGSLLAFLVFGPMLDFKSTLMLLSVFKARFVVLLISLVLLTVLFGSIIMGKLFLE